MRTVNILAIQRISAADRARIEAVDPAIRVTDAGGWFDGEIRDTWSAYAGSRYLAPRRHRIGHARRARPPARRGRLILAACRSRSICARVRRG